jgi:hypothetical protein
VNARVRRLWARFAVVAALAALAVGVTFKFVVLDYQPLWIDAVHYGEGSRLVDDGTVGGVTSGARVFPFRAGESFAYEFGIVNPGDRAVTVTDLPPPPVARYAELTGIDIDDPGLESASGGDRRDSSLATRWRPFDSVRLEPGDERFFRLSFRFASCDLAPVPAEQAQDAFSGGTTWDSQTVSYRVWKVPRTAELELLSRIGIEATGTCL